MKRGFTLIELLVVISIIALLSSVVFASVRVAYNKTQSTKHMQDARAFRTALSLYASDHNGTVPSYSGKCLGRLSSESCPLTGGFGSDGLYNALQPYIKGMPKGNTIYYSGAQRDGYGYSCGSTDDGSDCNSPYILYWIAEGIVTKCLDKSPLTNDGINTYCYISEVVQ